MQPKNPINIEELIKLTDLAVDPKYIKFGLTNLESDKYITIKTVTDVIFFHFFPFFFFFKWGYFI